MSIKTKIILVDWDQYPLSRNKFIGNRIIQCGIQPFLTAMKRHNKKDNFDVMLVINSEKYNCKSTLHRYNNLKNNYEFITSLHIRNNYAMDIGAYDFGFKVCIDNYFNERIVFVNSSVSGPYSDDWLDKYEELFISTPQIGLSGATVNMIPKDGLSSQEHVQSWFLYSDMKVLIDCFGESLLSKTATYDTKKNIVYNGEIGISQKIIDYGYGINCMAFPKLSFFKGDSWPFPFKIGWRGNKELSHLCNTTLV